VPLVPIVLPVLLILVVLLVLLVIRHTSNTIVTSGKQWPGVAVHILRIQNKQIQTIVSRKNTVQLPHKDSSTKTGLEASVFRVEVVDVLVSGSSSSGSSSSNSSDYFD
jgi:hypothetical protein